MVLTLKVISCAMNYSDGLLKEEEGLRDAQKKYRLTKVPSLVEYFGYCLCCGSHFAGPVYEMKDYLEWTERKGVSSLHLLWVDYALFIYFPDFIRSSTDMGQLNSFTIVTYSACSSSGWSMHGAIFVSVVYVSTFTI
jgi:lysophospholipid acyltransferase